ncbi:putative Biotin protein ligase [Operophtera brumata]|uniref:Putative Biotin protein ligase n=1 Tax=Operophtera brumata TaxID=104452 RepID=A0A0L7LR57_OPEBR|nr:putative Biotin protein ligase [Operophtera brumata]
MLFTPIYIAMTFIKSWRIRSFRARLLEFLNGNTSVAFCKVPENAAGMSILASVNKGANEAYINAYLCDLLDYTNTTRICSMKPTQCIEVSDWVSCASGLPLGSSEQSPLTDLDVDVLFECEMDPHEGRDQEVNTVTITGEPNKATDISMRSLRNDAQNSLRNPLGHFHWPVHAALLRKLSKVVDIKSDVRSTTAQMNGSTDAVTESPPRKTITLADVSCNTTKSLNADDEDKPQDKEIAVVQQIVEMPNSQEKIELQFAPTQNDDKECVLENVTVEIQHNITPKKSSLKLDLKKGTSQLSTSLLNISSQIKSVTTHKRVVSTTGPKRPSSQVDSYQTVKEESSKASPSQLGTPKSVKCSRPLVNTKSPNVLIYSDSVAARDNLEASLRKVLDCDRYTLYSITRESLESGAWRGRCALLAVAGCAGRGAPLLLAHLLDGGRLLALCSDLLHAVLPYYKTAEWKSVKMKHHIFCYQASPAKKQFSTESDRQPSKYAGHPGHELDIQVLASEETWRTPSLLQATDLTNGGIAIFSQVSTVQIRSQPGHELDIQVLASEETWRTPSLLQATDLTNGGIAIFSQIHLEADPRDYLGDEGAKSNEARLEIIHKILGDILGLHVKTPLETTHVEYTRGFFLGNHVHKMQLLERWCAANAEGCRLQPLDGITVQWCFQGETPLHPPSETFLPVHVYECPDHFSTVDYYDPLDGITVQWCFQGETPLHPPSETFIPVHVYECPDHFSTVDYYDPLDGITVQWCFQGEMTLHPPSETFLPVHVYECPDHFSTVDYYDPLDCITVQWCFQGETPLHPPSETFLPVHVYECPDHFSTVDYYDTPLHPPSETFLPVHVYECPDHFSTVDYYDVWMKMSPSLPLVQHASALAAVRAVRAVPGYEHLDIRIKWPNDIYFGRDVKIGGTITTANCIGDDVIVLIGVNVSNSVPTTCVNDMIAAHNARHGTALPALSTERFLARYCSQLERTLDDMTTWSNLNACAGTPLRPVCRMVKMAPPSGSAGASRGSRAVVTNSSLSAGPPQHTEVTLDTGSFFVSSNEYGSQYSSLKRSIYLSMSPRRPKRATDTYTE